MAMIVVRERVQDYDAFRKTFDGGDQMRRSAGVLDVSVYRAEGDSNTVLIVLRFASLIEAHAFSESASLRGMISQSGVEEGSRRVEFYEQT